MSEYLTEVYSFRVGFFMGVLEKQIIEIDRIANKNNLTMKYYVYMHLLFFPATCQISALAFRSWNLFLIVTSVTPDARAIFC